MLHKYLIPKTGKVKNIDGVGYYYFDGIQWAKFKGNDNVNTLYTDDGTITRTEL